MIYSARVFLALTSVLSGALVISIGAANAQCPAVDLDTGCGTVITISNTGSSISFSSQGPYEGADDTLVGVINNSNQPIFAMGLSSNRNIFGFDGDGIDAFGVPGNSKDGTGYGGPTAYFSNIMPGATSGL